MKSGVDGRRTCSKQRSITVIEEYFGTRFPVCCFPTFCLTQRGRAQFGEMRTVNLVVTL